MIEPGEIELLPALGPPAASVGMDLSAVVDMGYPRSRRVPALAFTRKEYLMRRSTHPALAAGVIVAVGLATAAATLSRHGPPDRPAPAATGAEITVAAPAPSRPAPSVRAPMTSGMVVAVDPETGELGMPDHGQLGQQLSIDEAQAYARQIAKELVTEHRPDGSSSLKHDERLVDYTIIRIGPDGEPVFQCVHGAHAVQSALRKDQPVPPAQEEE